MAHVVRFSIEEEARLVNVVRSLVFESDYSMEIKVTGASDRQHKDEIRNVR